MSDEFETNSSEYKENNSEMLNTAITPESEDSAEEQTVTESNNEPTATEQTEPFTGESQQIEQVSAAVNEPTAAEQTVPLRGENTQTECVSVESQPMDVIPPTQPMTYQEWGNPYSATSQPQNPRPMQPMQNGEQFRNPYAVPPQQFGSMPANGYPQQPYGNFNGRNMPSNTPYNMMYGGMYNPYMQIEQKPMPPKKKHTGLKIFGLCAALVVTAALVSGIVYILAQGDKNFIWDGEDSSMPSHVSSIYQGSTNLDDAPDVSADPNGPQISTQSTPESNTQPPAITAYQVASPSIVGITSYVAGSDVTLTQDGEGSGIILTEDGYIATNSHVVNDSKSTGVMVTISNGSQYLGTIIGVDAKTDIAVIKIDAKGLTAASFADSGSLIIGQTAYAIGNPGGLEFSNSLTQGTISALNRSLSSNGYVRYIQTDAAINPGNSGGALINEYGQVVGMNTAKIVGTDYEGMGFSIPSNQVLEIVNKLIKYGYVNDRATLGIEGKTCSLYTSKTTGVPQGMILTSINTTSPLFDTSAATGDIIIAIDGITVTSATDVIDKLKEYVPNDQIEIRFYRPKENSPTGAYVYTLTVTLIPESDS